MFGMRGAGAPPKNWNEMYFHQKLLHIVDSTADWVGSLHKWWLPFVGIGAAVSIFLFGAENGFQELIMMSTPVAVPIAGPSNFGTPLPQAPPGAANPEDFEDLI